ncbi:MAG: hypothetical protein NTZ68_01810 [Candidatus Dependentiae bacterium]|nr:hypothetical protein [Candidatus Dependentiae bacterium]
MFKKLMLVLGLGSCVGTDSVQARNNDDTAVVAIAVTVVAVGTGIYLFNRESNDVKIARVEALSRDRAKEIHALLSDIATLQDVQVFMLRVPEFEREINRFDNRVQSSYLEISARYDSYVTPWNNTVSMQRAYQTICDLRQQWATDVRLVHNKMHDMAQRMTALQIIAYFTPIMASWNFSTEEKDITKLARKICQGNSLYPMHDSIQKLQNALTIIYKTRQQVPCDPMLIDKMEQFSAELLSSAAYIDETRVRKEEKRAQEELEVKQRLALAEEKKACAQEQAARAATQQAKSQKSQNRIARERNRIERKRTGQESFWYDLCDCIDDWNE